MASMRDTTSRLNDFLQLMRFDKPIGTLLLLWPTLWALWLAADGLPSFKNLFIFVAGVTLMRSAGCVINDFADRNLDGHVERTKSRPLVTGRVSPAEALTLFAGLCLIAFGLVLYTNRPTILLAPVGLLLAASYPFMKRYTHFPQLVLGAAFAWGIPMAFTAETETLPGTVWPLFIAAILWTIIYDTYYAMVDREDDLKIGVKSTAILFGDMDLTLISWLQGMMLLALALTGANFDLGVLYYAGLLVVGLLFIYQQRITRDRDRDACFHAFLHNRWVGMAVFMGLFADSLFGDYLGSLLP